MTTGDPSIPTRAEREAMARSVPFWWHSIDLGDGVVTNGHKSAQLLRWEIDSLHLPDLRDKTVLDINTWDGFYAYAAEQRGARRVVALDQYVWQLDLPDYLEYWAECHRRGILPRPNEEMPFWRPDTLPGKRGFDVAHRLLRSTVEPVVADFMTMDIRTLDQFDIVLYLGTLYHMKNPLESLQRLAAVTRELAIIETAAIIVPGYEQRELFEFYERDELAGDFGNWWAPNEVALHGMCRAAGFRRVRTVFGPLPPSVAQRARSTLDYSLSQFARIWARVWGANRCQSQPPFNRLRLTVHALK